MSWTARLALPVACLALLATGAAAARAQDEPVFVCEAGNYEIPRPRQWQRAVPPNPEYQFVLRKGNNLIYVAGHDSGQSAELILERLTAAYRSTFDEIREVSRERFDLGGEPAIEVAWDIRNAGGQARLYATCWTHHGICYRVIGEMNLGRAEAFAQEYRNIARGLRYLRARTEWLARHEGTATPVACLGGLARFTLNRPRWTDTSLDGERDWRALDVVTFALAAQGAWITVRALPASGDVGHETEALAHFLRSVTAEAVVAPLPIAIAGGPVTGITVRGSYESVRRIHRAVAFVRDGIAVHVRLEALETREADTARDWAQLVSTFRLDAATSPAEPPAWRARVRESGAPEDRALGRVIAAMQRVLPGGSAGQVRGFHPDGSALALQADEGWCWLSPGNGTRETWPEAPTPVGPVAVSRDGSRAAWIDATGRAIAITRAGGPVQILDGPATGVAFGADAGTLLVCTRVGPADASLGASRLEAWGPEPGTRRVLLADPLAHVAWPTISPDGALIACASSRARPRTRRAGDNVWIGRADGTGWRSLTEGAEAIGGLAWSDDGRTVFALRRRGTDGDGDVGWSGPSDWWACPVDGRPPVDLTRCGTISGAWLAGGRAWLAMHEWRVPAEQHGLFVAPVEVLAAAMADAPGRPAVDPPSQRRAIATCVASALGGGPVAEHVLTPESLARIAEAFAQGAAETSGEALGFDAASLDRLSFLAHELALDPARDSECLLGLGAYYGETLRRVAGAEWRVRPRAFGAWRPGRGTPATPISRAVLPFSDQALSRLGSEDVELLGTEAARTAASGPRLVLVYPPETAVEAVRETSGPAWAEVLRLLDGGDIAAGLPRLVALVAAHPRNGELAREALSLCERAGRPDAARGLVRDAVAAGTQVPALLVRYADVECAGKPAEAIPYYRRAAEPEWGTWEALVKLGDAYLAVGRRDLAETCWRRAFRQAPTHEEPAIRQRLAWPESAAPSAPADPAPPPGGETR